MNKPEFGNVTYDDAGEYKCEVSVTGLRRHQSFDLVVEGEADSQRYITQKVIHAFQTRRYNILKSTQDMDTTQKRALDTMNTLAVTFGHVSYYVSTL